MKNKNPTDVKILINNHLIHSITYRANNSLQLNYKSQKKRMKTKLKLLVI